MLDNSKRLPNWSWTLDFTDTQLRRLRKNINDELRRRDGEIHWTPEDE